MSQKVLHQSVMSAGRALRLKVMSSIVIAVAKTVCATGEEDHLEEGAQAQALSHQGDVILSSSIKLLARRGHVLSKVRQSVRRHGAGIPQGAH